MATEELTQRQKELLASIELPCAIDPEMEDDRWFEIIDALGDEIQMRGINDVGDGINERGETCRQILEAMAASEEA